VEPTAAPAAETAPEAPAEAAAETAAPAPGAAAPAATPVAPKPAQQGRPEGQRNPQQQQRPPRENRPQGGGGGGGGNRPGGGPPNRERGPEGRGGERGGERGDRGPRPGGDRGGERGGGDRPRFEIPEIELEKLIADSLYLDNQAHAIVSRMRDMDTGTKSQLRRLYNAVRRAVRAPEGERQHEFVMLRARLAYTIARHSLRSLDQIEKLLLQVTRKNETRGYERFKDLFEAVIAYNE
jgi:CRISPR type III-A-associated protein Csm2